MNTIKRYTLLSTAQLLAVLDAILGTLIVGINWLSRQVVKGEEWAKRKAEEHET